MNTTRKLDSLLLVLMNTVILSSESVVYSRKNLFKIKEIIIVAGMVVGAFVVFVGVMTAISLSQLT
jgi:hypothetical protein